MEVLIMAIERAIVLLKMKGAQKAGQSASAFIAAMRKEGLSYRRQTMLSDWRNVGNIKAKEGLMRYVRKDYRPTVEIAQIKDWNLSKEFMHVVQVHTQTRPGEPLTQRWINIMGDKPMTPKEIESTIMEKLPEFQDSIPGIIAKIIPWTVIQKVVE